MAPRYGFGSQPTFNDLQNFANKGQRWNNRAEVLASLMRRRKALIDAGIRVPELSLQSMGEPDLARYNGELARLEKKVGFVSPTDDPRGKPEAPFARDAGADGRATFRAAAEALPPGGMGVFQPISDIIKSRILSTVDSADAAAAKKRKADATREASTMGFRMKSAYGPTTRKEGGVWKTDVPSESGTRSIDVAPTGTDSLRSRIAGYDGMTPAQRKEAIYAMTGGKPNFTDFRRREQDPRGMAYLKNLGGVLNEQAEAKIAAKASGTPRDWSKAGTAYAKSEAARRAKPAPIFVPADASRVVATPYGSGFARETKPQASGAPAGSVYDYFTDMSSKDVPSAMENRSTNLFGPASSSGTANKIGNVVVNPPGANNKVNPAPSAAPSVGMGDLKNSLNQPAAAPSVGMGDLKRSQYQPAAASSVGMGDLKNSLNQPAAAPPTMSDEMSKWMDETADETRFRRSKQRGNPLSESGY